MKQIRLIYRARLLMTQCLGTTLHLPFSIALAQGTAFTYQGRLAANGDAADGNYDLRFRLATDALAITTWAAHTSRTRCG